MLESEMVGVEAAADGALSAGAYMAIPYADKGKEGNFDFTLLASGLFEAEVAGFDMVKVSNQRTKTPMDKVFTTPFADVHLSERVHLGQLGTVYRGTLGGKQEVAVKRFSLLDANDKEYFKKEVGILRYEPTPCCRLLVVGLACCIVSCRMLGVVSDRGCRQQASKACERSRVLRCESVRGGGAHHLRLVLWTYVFRRPPPHFCTVGS